MRPWGGDAGPWSPRRADAGTGGGVAPVPALRHDPRHLDGPHPGGQAAARPERRPAQHRPAGVRGRRDRRHAGGRAAGGPAAQRAGDDPGGGRRRRAPGPARVRVRPARPGAVPVRVRGRPRDAQRRDERQRGRGPAGHGPADHLVLPRRLQRGRVPGRGHRRAVRVRGGGGRDHVPERGRRRRPGGRGGGGVGAARGADAAARAGPGSGPRRRGADGGAVPGLAGVLLPGGLGRRRGLERRLPARQPGQRGGVRGDGVRGVLDRDDGGPAGGRPAHRLARPGAAGARVRGAGGGGAGRRAADRPAAGGRGRVRVPGRGPVVHRAAGVRGRGQPGPGPRRPGDRPGGRHGLPGVRGGPGRDRRRGPAVRPPPRPADPGAAGAVRGRGGPGAAPAGGYVSSSRVHTVRASTAVSAARPRRRAAGASARWMSEPTSTPPTAVSTTAGTRAQGTWPLAALPTKAGPEMNAGRTRLVPLAVRCGIPRTWSSTGMSRTPAPTPIAPPSAPMPRNSAATTACAPRPRRRPSRGGTSRITVAAVTTSAKSRTSSGPGAAAERRPPARPPAPSGSPLSQICSYATWPRRPYAMPPAANAQRPWTRESEVTWWVSSRVPSAGRT